MPDSILYYGDNLDILRQHIPDGSVDLVYLDPSPGWNRDHAKTRVRTIEQLLAHQWFEFPASNVTLNEVERVQQETEQRPLL